ncbi:MAG: hypothetical protein E6G68_00150 [Actinobacteria bacterium]|nr:MAG: hypothetical protein E6G68_00150 [Actinomycetota bacterium]
MEDVRLPDLETIRRFSIAVRSEHAPAEQVIEALEMDLAKLQQALGRRAAPRPAAPRTRTTRTTRSR